MRSRTKNNRRLCTCQVKDEQHRRSPLDLPALELKDEQIRLSFHAWVQGRTDEHHSRYSLEAEYTGKHGGIQRDTKTSNVRLTRLIWIGRRCCCAWASRDLRSKLPMMHVKIASFFASHAFLLKTHLAYGGWARSTSGSQNLAVLPKRHDNSLFLRR